MKIVLNLILLLLITGCSGDTSLKGAFEKQMKEDQADGFNLIHLEDNETDGLALYTSWTDDYPDNKNKPGINYYEKVDGKWQSRTGTGCSDGGVSRLGLMGNGHLYCSILKENMDFEKILVDGTEANVFQVGDSIRVWYAVSDEKGAKVTGVSGGGREVRLN